MKSTLNPNATAWTPKETPKEVPKYQLPLGELPFVVVLIGPPGVGKSSQGTALQKLLHFEFLSIDDKLSDMRQMDPAIDANWSAKYCASMANNLLEEHVRKVKNDRNPGLVIEYVKTPDSAVIVEETCRRHGLKVNCTLLFNIDDILVLTSRTKNKGTGRRADLNPQFLLSKIHEFMFVEKAFYSHYHNAPGFRVLDATQSCEKVTADILDIIQQLHGPSPTEPLPEEDSDVPSASAMNFVPSATPFLQFVNEKAEVMTVLASIQNCIGLNINRDRRFPGSSTMTLDEAGLKNICTTDHRYVVSKKIVGLRYLLVHLKSDNGRPSCTYLVDRAFVAFRVQTFPATEAEWGDMLLDGCLVMLEGKAVFVVFDCLYYDGTRTIPENLDSRLEYVLKRFPMETSLAQQMATMPEDTCAVVCKQYYHIRDLPRLMREFELADPQVPYPYDGLIFTPKKNGYRTNFDPHLFKWKPVERGTVDFRLAENRQGGHDLLLARPVGKELREMPYDCLDSSVDLPASLVGSVVECRPVQKPDSMGMMRTTWQILNVRRDKNMPDREDMATTCLHNNLTSQRLMMLYHQFSQPEMYPVPGQANGLAMDPHLGRYSPTMGVPIFVGPQLPPSLMHLGAQAYAGGPPATVPLSSAMGPMQSQMYGSVGVMTPVVGPGIHLQQHYPMPPPSHRPYGMDPSPAPGILSGTAHMVNHSMGMPSVATVGLTPMGVYVPPPLSMQIRVGSPEAPPLPPLRDVTLNFDSALHGRVSPGGTPPADTVVVSMGPTLGPEDRAVGTPVRAPRAEGDSPEPSTPPDQQYTMHNLDHLSLTCDPKDQRRLGEWPFFQTPQNQRAPFGSLDLDSYEDRNHALLHMRAFDPANKENTPAPPNGQHEAGDKLTGKGSLSPGTRISFSPTSFGVKRTHPEFTSAVKDWVLRKFVPRPSAAKPRPFNAVDMAIGRGHDLPRWEKARCARLLGLSSSPAGVEECRSRMQGRDYELEAEFLCLDIHAEGFVLPDTVAVRPGKYEVAAMFFCLEHAFQSEAKARRAIANAASMLKPGGQLIIITNDSEAIAERVAQNGPRFQNSVFRFALHCDAAELTVGGFGLEYALEYEDSPPHRTYIVPQETLRHLCEAAGLERLPQDHGQYNFNDIAAYIEKSVSKGHLWRDLPKEDRELVTLWSTAVFQKAS